MNCRNYSMPARRRSRMRWLILPVMGLGIVIGLARMRHVRERPRFVMERPIPAALPADESTANEPYNPSSALLANQYPSRRTAIDAMTAQICDRISESGKTTPGAVQINGSADASDLQSLADAITLRWPAAKVEITAPASPNLSYDRESLYLSLIESHRSDSGEIEMSYSLDGKSRSISTGYSDHPWAADLASFLGDHAGQTWIIGHSNKAALNQAEAERMARQDAARQVEQFVRQQLEASSSRLGIPVAMGKSLNLPISDRFVQRFHRPYGDFWSEAVLVEIPHDYAQSIHHQQIAAIQRHVNHARHALPPLAIALLTILVGYAVLNGLTQSYFTGRLRALAVLLSFGVIVVAALVVMN